MSYNNYSYFNKPDGAVLSSYTQENTLLPASEWYDISFNQLLEQKSLLFERLEFLVSKQDPIAKAFAEHLQNIDATIAKRVNESTYR